MSLAQTRPPESDLYWSLSNTGGDPAIIRWPAAKLYPALHLRAIHSRDHYRCTFTTPLEQLLQIANQQPLPNPALPQILAQPDQWSLVGVRITRDGCSAFTLLNAHPTNDDGHDFTVETLGIFDDLDFTLTSAFGHSFSVDIRLSARPTLVRLSRKVSALVQRPQARINVVSHFRDFPSPRFSSYPPTPKLIGYRDFHLSP